MSKRPLMLGKSFAVVIEMLRDRPIFLSEIIEGIKLPSKIVALLICSSLFFAFYGAILGAFHSWQQALSSAVKLPVLYLITLTICLPTLYFFNVLFGSKKSFAQYLAMVLTAVAVISVLLFSFAPVSLFFLITTNHYQFIILLNVAIFAMTGFVGIKFLYQGMQVMAARDEQGLETRLNLLKFWLALYAFVGSQLGWTLRPFFGTPGTKFVLFREMEGNFYTSVFFSVWEMLQPR